MNPLGRGLISAIICSLIARRKRKNIIIWAIAGFIFGFIAIIGICFIKKDPDNMLK